MEIRKVEFRQSLPVVVGDVVVVTVVLAAVVVNTATTYVRVMGYARDISNY